MAERSSLGVSRAQDGRSERPATEVGDSDPKLRSLHVCPAGQASGLVINSTILSPHVRARPLHARLRHRAAPGLAISDRWSLARHPAWRSTQQSFHHMSVHGHFTPGCGIVPPRAWRSPIAGRWPGIRPGDQLNNPFTTCPCTATSRPAAASCRPGLGDLRSLVAGQASGLVINSTILSPHVRARPLHARLRHRAAPGLAIFDRWSLARHPAW
jgi:hypothetical protein